MARFVDLSHPIVSGMAPYPGMPAPRIDAWLTHDDSRARYDGQAEFEIFYPFMDDGLAA